MSLESVQVSAGRLADIAGRVGPVISAGALAGLSESVKVSIGPMPSTVLKSERLAGLAGDVGSSVISASSLAGLSESVNGSLRWNQEFNRATDALFRTRSLSPFDRPIAGRPREPRRSLQSSGDHASPALSGRLLLRGDHGWSCVGYAGRS